jgi:16S rRNA (guanine966-N2)-methyltransferase
MRIISGKFKGRRLFTPKNDAIRPTSDRTRESLFNLLMHGSYAGEHIIDQRVVDLCCGTGALGLEAISRGASECVFIDQDKTAIALAKENAMHCQAIPQCQFLQADISRLPQARQPVALVLMDAPYDTPLAASAYRSLQQGGWLEKSALIVVEQPAFAPIELLPSAELIDERKYGKTKLLVYKVAH